MRLQIIVIGEKWNTHGSSNRTPKTLQLRGWAVICKKGIDFRQEMENHLRGKAVNRPRMTEVFPAAWKIIAFRGCPSLAVSSLKGILRLWHLFGKSGKAGFQQPERL
ncbi:hypothetical protein CDAR_281011 [Caerostris darwini]|uniref:Uncharacterized protein n=1 Tax=Caerostris darwini TaxID=1538125 RepID=A0AAV4VA12_9ARAC|nr:hypothetical protein CDAR_281011 [Caerostris darwini]